MTERIYDGLGGSEPSYGEAAREREGVWEGDGWARPGAGDAAGSDVAAGNLVPAARGNGASSAPAGMAARNREAASAAAGDAAAPAAAPDSAHAPSAQRTGSASPAGDALEEEAPLDARERLNRRLGRAAAAQPAVSPAPKRTTRTGEPKETKERAQRVKEKAYEKTPERFKNASSFQVRLRTGAVYITLNIVCILASDITTALILAATAAVCAGEFYYMLRSDAKMPNELIGIVAAAAYPLSVYFIGFTGIIYVTALLTLAVTIWYVYWLRARVADVGVCMFGAVYTGMQLTGLLLIRMSIGGIWGGVVVLVIFASIWFNDAGAYVVGSRIGKHKLAPRTSPNKSWEGFIFGLVVSMAFWCILVAVPGVSIAAWQCCLFGLVCGLTSVLGDLCESRIKRSVGFKDSGTIMPGHGGLLDRCDSLMPTAVAAAILLFGAGCLPWPL